ncbi:MAG: hypothetical protein NC092_03475 [Butyrivibrio sp.]|nr:hypothetical protein [Muribaculum sp.]MCM1551735.1 hypothetical protein [Butyrivibrio sp.]
MKEEYFADDRGIIPEYIKKMTREELELEIERLEREVKEKNAKNQKLAATV